MIIKCDKCGHEAEMVVNLNGEMYMIEFWSYEGDKSPQAQNVVKTIKARCPGCGAYYFQPENVPEAKEDDKKQKKAAVMEQLLNLMHKFEPDVLIAVAEELRDVVQQQNRAQQEYEQRD